MNGADAGSQGPVHQPGGISFVETAYAKNVGLPVASVVNAAGNAVQPSSYNVAVALTGAILYQDLTQNLAGVYTNTNPDAYPLSAYSYFIAQCVPSQAAAQNFACDSSGNVTMGAAQGAELAQFITFVACLGQKTMATLGYSPIPPNLVEDDFQAAGRLPGGTTPARTQSAELPEPVHHRSTPTGRRSDRRRIGESGRSDVGAASAAATAAQREGRCVGPWLRRRWPGFHAKRVGSRILRLGLSGECCGRRQEEAGECAHRPCAGLRPSGSPDRRRRRARR